MKKYIKQSNILNSVSNKIKVFTSLPLTSAIEDNELFIVKNNALYKKSNNAFTVLLANATTSIVPIGEIKAFYGNNIPSGWLECNGSQFSSSLYPSLYNFLGTNILPDFRECVPVGSSTAGVFSDDRIETHNHGGTHYVLYHRHCLPPTAHCHTTGYCCMTSGTGKYGNCEVLRTIECLSTSVAGRTGMSLGAATQPMCISQHCYYSGAKFGSVTREVETGVRFIIYTGE